MGISKQAIMHAITVAWLHRFSTERRGLLTQAQRVSAGYTWSREQFAVLGLDCPPPHGWIKRLEGAQVPDETARAFEHAQTWETKTAKHYERQRRKADKRLRSRQIAWPSDDL